MPAAAARVRSPRSRRAAFWFVFMYGTVWLGYLATRHESDSPPLVLPLLVTWFGLSGFAGHLWLLVLMMLPPPPDPIPIVAKA